MTCYSQVCLVRVLHKQPALLALDEATSALDQKTDVLTLVSEGIGGEVPRDH